MNLTLSPTTTSTSTSTSTSTTTTTASSTPSQIDTTVSLNSVSSDLLLNPLLESDVLSTTMPSDDEPALSSYARCADGNGTLSFLFFSEDDFELARAKTICRGCGLQETCLSGAVEREEPYGVWGGKLVLDGVPVEFKRKRGRPPKHPRPVLEVEEAPIPPHLVA